MLNAPICGLNRSRLGERITAIILSAASFVCHAFAAELTGRSSVIDGDTSEILGQRIHLSGVDAPEMGLECFQLD